MTTSAHDTILNELRTWPEVEIGDTGRMGTQFAIGKIELGHLHGSSVAHLPFPKAIRNDLIARNEAVPHPVMPNSGWLAREIHSPADTDAVIALFRLNYDRAIARGKLIKR